MAEAEPPTAAAAVDLPALVRRWRASPADAELAAQVSAALLEEPTSPATTRQLATALVWCLCDSCGEDVQASAARLLGRLAGQGEEGQAAIAGVGGCAALTHLRWSHNKAVRQAVREALAAFPDEAEALSWAGAQVANAKAASPSGAAGGAAAGAAAAQPGAKRCAACGKAKAPGGKLFRCAGCKQVGLCVCRSGCSARLHARRPVMLSNACFAKPCSAARSGCDSDWNTSPPMESRCPTATVPVKPLTGMLGTSTSAGGCGRRRQLERGNGCTCQQVMQASCVWAAKRPGQAVAVFNAVGSAECVNPCAFSYASECTKQSGSSFADVNQQLRSGATAVAPKAAEQAQQEPAELAALG